MDWSQTKIRGWGNTKGHLTLTLKETGREEDLRIAGGQLSKKWIEAGMI
jgi:hypothetical protein